MKTLDQEFIMLRGQLECSLIFSDPIIKFTTLFRLLNPVDSVSSDYSSLYSRSRYMLSLLLSLKIASLKTGRSDGEALKHIYHWCIFSREIGILIDKILR